ncbi:RNA helicase ATP-dependent DEAD-box conserved site [Macrophomina phaseolina MS6]|uniref:RNA helicase n=1 Tax=Macrophomina phaseolina (strain MS6) TaxID=1126212 RepID=K2R8Y2_MACPH|nr:RNA helicase ATP-dependent DEAD-box conserved site [Macrophomina phaseolina MS6]
MFIANDQGPVTGANTVTSTPKKLKNEAPTPYDAAPASAPTSGDLTGSLSVTQAKKQEKILRKEERVKQKEEKAMHKVLKAEEKRKKREAKLAGEGEGEATEADADASGEAGTSRVTKKQLRKAESKDEQPAKKAEKAAKKAAKRVAVHSGEVEPEQNGKTDRSESDDASPGTEVNEAVTEDTDMPDAPSSSDENTESAPAETSEENPKKAKKEKKKEEKEKKEKREKKEKKERKEKTEKKEKKDKSEKKSNKENKHHELAEVAVSEVTPVPATNGAAESAASSYVQDPALAALSQSEIDAFLSKHFIAVTDPLGAATKLRPIISFDHLPVTDESLRAPFASFTAPTPIQAAAWPSLLSGRDVIGVAETGSGKTLGFGVPCVRHIMSLPKAKGVKAVIVSPTRELASQIHEQLVKIAEPAGLKSVCIYGGVPKDEQKAGLKKASIVVATPGRLNDLIDEGAADISKAGYVVLDEADRMLDKGFEDAIRKIISSTRPINERQTLMFTATWPKSVQELASTFMKSPVKITIGDNPTGELRANTRITQTVEVVDPRDKEYRLTQILKEHTAGSKKNDRILIFCLYKKEATRVEETLRRKGFKVGGIHGDLSQAQRTASLEKFKKGEIPLLVATDVAARGLDIPAVKLVVNVTFPLTAEDYVHRIGRTGRAGQDGKAITLFTEHDKPLAGALVNVLKGANQPVPEELMKFGTTVKKKGHEAYGAFFKDTTDMKQATKITFDD